MDVSVIAKELIDMGLGELQNAQDDEAQAANAEAQAKEDRETYREVAQDATIQSSMSKRSLQVEVGSERNDTPGTPWYHKKLILPRKMGVAQYTLVVIFGAALACTISFTLLPLSNPLHDPEMHGWWHCPLTCTLVWVPLSTLYIAELLDLLVLDGIGNHLRVIDLFELWAITAGTIDVIYTTFSFFILYPFPMVSLFEAPLAFLLCAVYLYFYTIPRITQDMDSEEAKGLMSQAFYVLGFYEWSLLQLQVLLILFGWLQHSEMSTWMGPIVAIMGETCNAFSASLAEKVDPRATVLGLNVSMVTFGIVQAELAGSVGNVAFTLLMLSINFLFTMPAVCEIIQLKICNIEIGRMFMFRSKVIRRCFKCESPLLPDVHVHQVKDKIIEDRTSMLACEAAEMFVPLAYLLSWIFIYLGPNASHFAGVEDSEFGLHAPKHVHTYVGNMGIVVVYQMVSFFVIHTLLKCYSPEGLLDEAQYFLERYGTILASQSVFIIQSAIMHSMIACGIDYSWKFNYVKEQFPQKVVGRNIMHWLGYGVS